MKIPCRSRLVRWVVVASSLGLTAVVHGQSIGLNFVGGNGDTTDILSLAQSAGVVPQINWNDLTGSNTSSTTDGITILDSTGASTPVIATWTNNARNYDNSSTSQVSPLTSNGDQVLNNGGIWGAGQGGAPSVTLTGIPYSSYEVIVTSLLDHGGTIISTTLGGLTVYADQTQNPQDPGYIDGTSNTFTYTQSTDTTGAGTPGGDYAEFTGLTGSSVTISEDIVSGNATNANLSSIEIVNTAVPEPASAGLLGVCSLGLLSRFRRRRA